jgi:hypothetical protein
MIELFIVVPCIAAIVRTAKGRGVSPWLYAFIALLGFLLVGQILAGIIDPLLFESGDPSSGAVVIARLTVGLAPFAWLVLTYFHVRFVAGRSHAQPVGQWTCPECRWLNSAANLKCDACGYEYVANRLTT